MGRPRLTTKDFIAKAREIHGNEYDYSHTECGGRYESLTIICPKHGEFTISRARNHLHHGTKFGTCRTCMEERSQQKNTELFFSNAQKVHGSLYDYSLVKYINAHVPIIIICPEHGEFTQYPLAHITQGSGCFACSVKRRRKS